MLVNNSNKYPLSQRLPSAENATKALDAIPHDPKAWRSLVLEAIEYATTISNDENDAARKESTEQNISERIRETVLFFRKSLENISNNNDDAHDDGNNNSGVRSCDILDTAQGIIVDALWLMGTMLRPHEEDQGNKNKDTSSSSSNSTRTSTSSSYTALCQLTRAIMEKPKDDPKLIAIPSNKFMTSLEPQHLRDSNILSNQYLDLFIKKIRKLNTDTYYRQKKVNLLQEESEGYAKFVRILTNLPLVHHHGYETGGESFNHDVASIEKEPLNKLSQTLKLSTVELIGTFDLDPNRCLDLTIDALESTMQQVLISKKESNCSSSYRMIVRDAKDYATSVHLLLELMHLFPKGNICHLIGFKYASYRNGGVNAAKAEMTTTPQSLFVTTALLASHGLLSLSALQPHLPPILEIENVYDVWREDYVKKIKKMGVVSLNASKQSKDQQEGGEGGKMGHTAMETNQCLQLLCVLLDVGFDWNMALELFQSKRKQSEMEIKELVMKCCCVYPPLGGKICDVLEHAIGPLMDAKVKSIGPSLCCLEGGHEVGQVVVTPGERSCLLPTDWYHKHPLELSSDLTLQELCSKIDCFVDPIVMSGSIASKPILYCKLCRLFRAMLLEEGSSQEAEITNVHDCALEFIEKVLVAPLSLFPYNPAIASELWSVLSTLSFHIRYALYATWRKHGLEKAALRSKVQPPKPLAQIESEVSTGISTKYLLKRMSKDNIRDMGKQVSKVAHNNPLVVFTLMLNQIESYDNLILIMVDTFKFMSVLSLDVMGYCLLVSLGGEGETRDKLKGKSVGSMYYLEVIL